ncbi:hypothetical protein EDD16DRAFT_1703108 [Pisolithus croceorrhizus]|nr:hypothetical protein EDD16DRAFT_1703108 [Pisolithus croceorrhizus]
MHGPLSNSTMDAMDAGFTALHIAQQYEFLVLALAFLNLDKPKGVLDMHRALDGREGKRET